MATTIKISEDMRDELKMIGKMGDSYEDVIKQLIMYFRNGKNHE